MTLPVAACKPGVAVVRENLARSSEVGGRQAAPKFVPGIRVVQAFLARERANAKPQVTPSSVPPKSVGRRTQERGIAEPSWRSQRALFPPVPSDDPDQDNEIIDDDESFPPPPCSFFFSDLGCRYGEECRFSHDDSFEHEDEGEDDVLPAYSPVPVCPYFAGGCRFGVNCMYAHPPTYFGFRGVVDGVLDPGPQFASVSSASSTSPSSSNFTTPLASPLASPRRQSSAPSALAAPFTPATSVQVTCSSAELSSPCSVSSSTYSFTSASSNPLTDALSPTLARSASTNSFSSFSSTAPHSTKSPPGSPGVRLRDLSSLPRERKNSVSSVSSGERKDVQGSPHKNFGTDRDSTESLSSPPGSKKNSLKETTGGTLSSTRTLFQGTEKKRLSSSSPPFCPRAAKNESWRSDLLLTETASEDLVSKPSDTHTGEPTGTKLSRQGSSEKHAESPCEEALAFTRRASEEDRRKRAEAAEEQRKHQSEENRRKQSEDADFGLTPSEETFFQETVSTKEKTGILTKSQIPEENRRKQSEDRDFSFSLPEETSFAEAFPVNGKQGSTPASSPTALTKREEKSRSPERKVTLSSMRKASENVIPSLSDTKQSESSLAQHNVQHIRTEGKKEVSPTAKNVGQRKLNGRKGESGDQEDAQNVETKRGENRQRGSVSSGNPPPDGVSVTKTKKVCEFFVAPPKRASEKAQGFQSPRENETENLRKVSKNDVLAHRDFGNPASTKRLSEKMDLMSAQISSALSNATSPSRNLSEKKEKREIVFSPDLHFSPEMEEGEVLEEDSGGSAESSGGSTKPVLPDPMCFHAY